MPNDFTTADLASWHASRQQLKRIAQREPPADTRRRAGSGFAAGQGGPMPAAAGAPGVHPGAGAYAGAPPGGDPAAAAAAAAGVPDPADLPAALQDRIDDFKQLAEDLRGADTAGVEDTGNALAEIADLLEEKLIPKLEAAAESHGEALEEIAEQEAEAEEEREAADAP